MFWAYICKTYIGCWILLRMGMVYRCLFHVLHRLGREWFPVNMVYISFTPLYYENYMNWAPLFELTLLNYSWPCNQRKYLDYFIMTFKLLYKYQNSRFALFCQQDKEQFNFKSWPNRCTLICLLEREKGENPTTIENLWQDVASYGLSFAKI